MDTETKRAAVLDTANKIRPELQQQLNIILQAAGEVANIIDDDLLVDDVTELMWRAMGRPKPGLTDDSQAPPKGYDEDPETPLAIEAT